MLSLIREKVVNIKSLHGPFAERFDDDALWYGLDTGRAVVREQRAQEQQRDEQLSKAKVCDD